MGAVKESCSNVIVTAAQADTDNLIGCPVPSNARVSEVLLSYADAITGGAINPFEGEPGPLMLQGDHGKVRFRNIVVTPAS